MRIRTSLAVSTLLSGALASGSFAATIPVGASTGAAIFNPAIFEPDGCCGEEIRVGASPGAVGTWTLSGGQTFSLNPPTGVTGTNASPYAAIGRRDNANGTVTLTGPGTAFSLIGNNTGATVQIGRQGGTGTVNVHNGATFSIFDPNSTTSDNDDAVHLGESAGTGTLDVDASTVSIQTSTGAALYVGANNTQDNVLSGTGIANFKNNSALVLRDLANAVPFDQEIGAQFHVAQGEGTSGTVIVDHSNVTIDGEDSDADLLVGQRASQITSHMTVTNGSTVNIFANSQNTAKGANAEADLIVGANSGSKGILDVADGSQINLGGPFVYVGIGSGEGSNAEMTMSGGSTLSDGGSDSYVQVGKFNPTGDNGSIGKLTVTGSGTQFDVTGEIDVGQGQGAGSSQGILKVENGGGVTASAVNLNRGGTLTGNGGTINADINLHAGGAIAPGASPGTMTINGDLNSNNGTVQVQIGGNTPSLYDQLIVNGDLNAPTPLNIEVSFLNSFLPSDTDSFDFLLVKGIINSVGDPLNVNFVGYTGSFLLAFNNGAFRLSNLDLTATTPIPAALPLLASTIAGLGAFGYRRRKKGLIANA